MGTKWAKKTQLSTKIRLKQSNPMEKLLKIEQLAEALQVSKRTVYDWTHTNYIPYYKLGKGIRFKRSEIERWIKRRNIKPKRHQLF